MDRPRAGSRGLTDDLRARARAWAERFCMDQDLPLHVTDRRAIDAVVTLLKPGGGHPAGSQEPAPRTAFTKRAA
jgi:hypothetical protein